MSLCDQAVDARVDCTVRVARDADGTLADGAASQLARVDGVETVEDVAVAGIEPRLNDLAVDLEASVRVVVPIDDGGDATLHGGREEAVQNGREGAVQNGREDAVQTVLAGGFGVDVAGVRIET